MPGVKTYQRDDIVRCRARIDSILATVGVTLLAPLCTIPRTACGKAAAWEQEMIIVVGPFTPTSYDAWIEFHHQHLDAARAAGIVSDRVCRPIGEPDKLLVIQEVDDFDRFMAFMSSPEAEAMRTATPVAGEYAVVIAEELERPI
ncbi:MAG TPA: hypothetical protein VFK32_05785 [Tepidiformaceae bacterium]|nr:hypothetical protein [Tepidiformaceae bacterium]